jgi:hypothetical protein
MIRAANLFITNFCNRSCSFCDVKDWVVHNEESAYHMTEKDIRLIIDWLKRSGLTNVQLAGGEPMIHPNIVGIAEELVRNNIQVVTVLTNGLGDTKLYERVSSIAKPGWLVNIGNPKTYTSGQWELLNRNLELLKWKGDHKLIGHRMFDSNMFLLQLAITFYKPGQDYGYIIDIAKKHNCMSIRFDVSHPSSDLSNIHFNFQELTSLKPVLINFLRDCINEGIKPNLDCVLPPCIFTSEEMLFSFYHAGFKSVCYPCLDIMFDREHKIRAEYCTVMRGVIPSFDIEKMNAFEIAQKHAGEARKYVYYLANHCKGCSHFINEKGWKNPFLPYPFPCQGYCLRLKVDEMNSKDKHKNDVLKNKSSVLGRIRDFIR